MKAALENVCRKSRKRKRSSFAGYVSRKKLKHCPVPITTHTECCFCKEGENKDYGTFFSDEAMQLAAHQFCLLFSAGLPQLGEDEEGFDGFLVKDILKEVSRAQKIICKICGQAGANSGCSVKSCRCLYHFRCGLKHGNQFIFADAFDSYCLHHRSHQDLSPIKKMMPPSKCPVCLEEIIKENHNTILKTPCCKNVFMHRECIQLQADTSGYFFRCPTCNNEKLFTYEMSKYGIYVPLRDAAWEESNAYSELLEQYNRCDMLKCKCRRGRGYHTQSGPWNVLRCYACGQSGVHVLCLGSRYIPGFGYVCSDCNKIICKAKACDMNVVQKTYQDRWAQHKLMLQQLKARDDPVLLASAFFGARIWRKRFNIRPCSVVLENILPPSKNSTLTKVKAKKNLANISGTKSRPVLKEAVKLNSNGILSSKVTGPQYEISITKTISPSKLEIATKSVSSEDKVNIVESSNSALSELQLLSCNQVSPASTTAEGVTTTEPDNAVMVEDNAPLITTLVNLSINAQSNITCTEIKEVELCSTRTILKDITQNNIQAAMNLDTNNNFERAENPTVSSQQSRL